MGVRRNGQENCFRSDLNDWGLNGIGKASVDSEFLNDRHHKGLKRLKWSIK